MNCCITSMPFKSTLIINERPPEPTDCTRLTFSTLNKFDPKAIDVKLNGRSLTIGAGNDFTLGVDNKSFTLLIDSNDPTRLKEAPESTEEILVTYCLAPDSSCITTF